jgi:hypothetical protein
MSTQKKPEKNEPSPNDVSLERQVFEAMRSLGRIIPTSEEDVERAEALLAKECVGLPEELKDPYQTLESMDSDCPSFEAKCQPANEQVEANLARAAREGGAILPEIEQRMRRDRRDAEQRIA